MPWCQWDVIYSLKLLISWPAIWCPIRRDNGRLPDPQTQSDHRHQNNRHNMEARERRHKWLFEMENPGVGNSPLFPWSIQTAEFPGRPHRPRKKGFLTDPCFKGGSVTTCVSNVVSPSLDDYSALLPDYIDTCCQLPFSPLREARLMAEGRPTWFWLLLLSFFYMHHNSTAHYKFIHSSSMTLLTADYYITDRKSVV